MINGNGGLEWAASRCDRSAEILYGWADASGFATPFVADPADRSHVVGTIDFDSTIDANTISAVLLRNGIVDTDSYASSAETTCASRCSRRSNPTTSPRSPRRSTSSSTV